MSMLRYCFGNFILDTGARVLLGPGADGAARGLTALPLTPKEYQTLLLLVSAQGNALERNAMIRAIWPDTVVGETSLGHNISALRRHLGPRAILSVPRFGYRLSVPVSVQLAGLPQGSRQPRRSVARIALPPKRWALAGRPRPPLALHLR